jgi:D-alanyl-D-alanine carboxypeptidase (penicillin-binding protein 5/6)
MKMNLKTFLIVFLLSLPFWWGINLLEKDLKDFFFWQEISRNPQIFTAQIVLEEELRDLKPIRDKKVEDLEIGAKSAISVLFKNSGEEKILFEKNINQKLPIASLTKLMTAKVVLGYYDLSKEIKVSEEAVAKEEDFGKLKAGKKFLVEYLLYPLLMESSNDAAFALSNDYDETTEGKFVELMNREAQKMNLKNTHFTNSSGLDPEEPETEINYSTITDLTGFTKELLKESLIWEILSTPKFDLYGPELINNNELLFDESVSWQARIIGGKTGYTDMAGGCFLLVLKAPKNSGYLVNVILGTSDSNNRFIEMRKLAEWVQKAYSW